MNNNFVFKYHSKNQLLLKNFGNNISMRKILYIIYLLISLLIIGCSGVNFKQWNFPYYMQVTQGTYVTTEMVNQIHVGMSKNEVNLVLDRPVNQFLFNSNRWDFVYQNYINNKLVRSYNLTLIFNKDVVEKIIKTNTFFHK